jgi:hypothetical protein
MSGTPELAVQRFEPVYLELEPAKITEYGKRRMDSWMSGVDRFWGTIRDIAKVAYSELREWDWMQRTLDAEGVPQNIANGISQSMMHQLLDHAIGKLAFTFPATVAMSLDTANPSSTSTGASQAETVYTGYGRQTLAGAAFVAATTATPAVSTNSGTITFANCTGTGSTLLGFTLDDSATIGAGNVLWFGGLTSTSISTTQTPPTVAAGALSLSLATSP